MSSPIEQEAERRASLYGERMLDSESARKRDKSGMLEHAIVRQLLADAIRWGMEHQRELTETFAAEIDASLDTAI